jgi:hypothetical protein
MDSQVAVINEALLLLGVDEIMDIEENSTPARKAKAAWPGTRDEVMRVHPWKCCSFRASLAQAGTPPAWGWSYRYQLPTDPYCLRVLRMEDPEAAWTVEGRSLLTNETTANILHIGRVDIIPNWDALLAECVAGKLAAKLAFKLTASSKLRTEMFDYYNKILKEARSVDAMEGQAERDSVDWISARY